MLNSLLEWVIQNLAWEVICSLVFSIMATALFRNALNMLTDNKQVIWFFGCSFVGMFALAILFGRGQATAKPNLDAHIESFMWGGAPPNPLKSPVFIIASIKNTGSMDSIANGYKIILNIGGRSYTGALEALDKSEKITFHFDGKCASYYGDDALAEKTANPVQVGANVTGIMLFTFQDLDSDMLKSENYLDITLRFRDVTGAMHSISDSRVVRNPSAPYIAGIRQDFQCSS